MTMTVPLKRVAWIRYGLGQPPKLSDSGVPILRATNVSKGRITEANMLRAALADLPLDRAPLLAEGEILLVRSGAYTGDSARITAKWAGSAPGYDLRVTPESIDSRYLAYSLLGSAALDQMALASTRAAQPHLNAEELGEVEIWLPPLKDQRRIADFLDAETTRIDHLLDLRQQQQELLKERSFRQVYDAVRGAHIEGNRRESGLEWLGSVPADWRIGAVSHYFEVELGKMLNQERTQGEHLRSYLRVANVQWDKIDVSELAMMDFPPEEQVRYRLKPGDLLVNEGGSWPGRAAVWNGELPEVYYQKALHRIRARGAELPRWLYYCLVVAERLRVFQVQGNTSTMTHLTREQLRPQRFPFPAPDMQRALVARLDRAAHRDLEISQLLHNQFDLLTERRQALITAAVTGQFDVSTASGRNVTDGVGA